MSQLFQSLFVSFVGGMGNAALNALRAASAGGSFAEKEGDAEDLKILDPLEASRSLESLTAAQLKAPFKSVSDLRREQEDRLRELGSAATEDEVRRLGLIAQIETLDGKVAKIDEALQRPEARLLGKELRKALAKAVETGDLKSLDGWDDKFAALSAYAQAESRMFQVLTWAKSRFPEEGRFALELDFSAENPRVAPYLETCRPSGPCKALSEFEPSVEHYRQLPIIRVYEELKNSKNEDDRRIAQAAESALAGHDLYEKSRLNDWVLDRRGDRQVSWEGLEHMTGMIEAAYGSKELNKDLQAFSEKVSAKERNELENNEGYKARKEFAASVKALEGFDADIATAKLSFDEFKERHDVSKLDGFQKFLTSRAASYRDFLRSEEQAIAREEAVAHGASNMDGTDQALPPPPPSDRLLGVQDKLARAEQALQRLSALAGEEGQTQFEGLTALTPDVAAMEDQHARALLEKMAAMSSPSGDASSAVSIDELPQANFKERAQYYGGLEDGIRKSVMIRMVEGRIKQYESFQDEKETSDDIKSVIKAPFAIMGPAPDVEEGRPEITNWDMIHAYREILGKLKTGEEVFEKQALEDFSKLESIRGHATLYEAYSGNALFNGMTLGIGIIVAAAATGGVAAELAAPFVEGMAGGSAILTGINGTVFTLTQKLLDSAARGKNPLEEIFQGATLVECGLNSLMFGWMDRVMGRFEKVFEKGLDVFARRNVAKSLGRAVTEGDAELVAKEVAALRENVGVQATKSAAGFLYEAAKFQQWGFYVEVGRGVANGESQPVEKALKHALSMDGFLQNAQFLVGLKVASVASMPIFGPLQGAAQRWAMGKRVELALKDIDAEIGGLQGRFDESLVSGKEDALEIAGQLKDRLAAREKLISEIPEQFQNDRFRQVKDFHREVREDLERFERVARGTKGLFDAGNRFGVKTVRDGDRGGAFATYDPAQKDAFRQTLNKLLGGWNVKVLGSVIEAKFTFPGGTEQTVVFSPAS